MKFEKTVRVRTHDGVDHDSVEAAKRHLFKLNFVTLGSATAEDIESATTQRDTEDPHLKTIRDAIRQVALVAWPRAKSTPAAPEKAAKSVEPEPEPEIEYKEIEAPATRRSRH